ncbi:HCL070Wp [Eremothecium sinecaudum]|uniref:ADP-ribosylation factor n=1 Tax=Eremothecium sinecaudum TaxID=45286 RepID=A0A0X8HQF6_9SACH|nr:HCL070Wp [Eremothecium sinecaudum]AMD20081.1 HCL070Wp [Eremothecium sinecaudum]
MMILILGIENAGKSTLLQQLEVGDICSDLGRSVPVEFVEYKNVVVLSWDPSKLQDIYTSPGECYRYSKAFIFVVDATDTEHLRRARIELHRIMSTNPLGSRPLLIWSNKQDLPEALSNREVCRRLGISSRLNSPWLVQDVSALSGKGIYEGLQWLTTVLESKHKGISINDQPPSIPDQPEDSSDEDAFNDDSDFAVDSEHETVIKLV